MLGPSVVWYIAISASLFAIGVARRPAAAQPADHPALARDHAERRQPRADRVLAAQRRGIGTDLRAHGDGGRRLRGRRRPRPDRRDVAAPARARRRQAGHAPRMIAAAWICLVSPLAAALLITLGGMRIPRRATGWIATVSTTVSFTAALVALIGLLGEDGPTAVSPVDGVDVARRGQLPRRPHDPARSVERLHDARRLRRRHADRRVLDRLHGRRGRGAALLRVHGAVRLLDAPARAGRQPADAARRLGPRRAQLLPPDRLLPGAAERGRRGEEGVHHERGRRRDDGARAVPADRAHGHAQLRARCRRSRTRAAPSSTSSRSACSAARSRSPRSCRCTRGCPTRWRARRR